MSFVPHREQVSFDPRHVTRSPPIGNVSIYLLVLEESSREISPGKSGPWIKPGTRNIPEHPGTRNNYQNYEENTKNQIFKN